MMNDHNEEHYRKLERMYAGANSQKGFTPVIKIGDATAELTLPVREEYFHAANAVHGHVYFKAMDDTAFFAANSLAENTFVLTISFNLYFLRPINGGEMRAFGQVVHQSKNLYIADSKILNSEGKEIARGSGTFMKSKVSLTPEIGYQ